MQLHVSPQQLHFPAATPPRSERSKLSPGRRPDSVPASLFNNDASVPAIFQPAFSDGVVRTPSHTSIPCSTLPARRSPCEACRLAVFSLSNILIPAISHSRQTHITLGLRFCLSTSSTLRSQGYPQVLFEPHSNSLAQSRKVAQGGVMPLLRMSARRLADRVASMRETHCAHRRDDSPMSPRSRTDSRKAASSRYCACLRDDLPLPPNRKSSPVLPIPYELFSILFFPSPLHASSFRIHPSRPGV